MSGDQPLTAGSSVVTSSEDITPDSNPLTDTKPEIPGQATKIDELTKSLEEYGSTLAEIAVAKSDSKFKEELSAIESWYQVLSRSERTTSVYTLLQHSDQDQKRFYIALLQQLLQAESNANENVQGDDSQLKTKPFARGLRPPSLNLPLPGSPATPRFTPATSRGESLPFIGASNTVNTPSFSMFTRTNENENGSTLNEGLNVGTLNPQALNAVAGSGLSTEAQLLAIQLVMSGLVQPQPQAIPKSARKHLNNWRVPPPSAKYPGSALRHSALRSAGLKSAGLKSAVPDSAMEPGVTPKEEDFNPEVLNDIPGWLRSLRLHKYTPCFEGMTWQEMVVLDDDGLEKKGIATLGARRRLLRTFEIVKKKQGMEGSSNAAAAGVGEEVDPQSAEAAAAAKSSLSANSPVFIPRELRLPQNAAPA